MDRLPKHNELVFERLRKTLYLRLTTVIRSLSAKFGCTVDSARVRKCIDDLSSMCYGRTSIPVSLQQNKPYRIHCVLCDVRLAGALYKRFTYIGIGDRRRTKKLEAGIARLEWLRDNWDDLEVTGDLKRGYELEIKK